jgi:hypothetical protein
MTDETMEKIVLSLNELEKAVLEEMRRKTVLDGLAEQINEATVERRNNTGAGFYTKLLSNKGTKRIENAVLSGVYAHVTGLNHPMVFVLFVKDGMIDTLEGAAVEDSTVSIDFSRVTFEIIQ